jgi:hypothetical protein
MACHSDINLLLRHSEHDDPRQAFILASAVVVGVYEVAPKTGAAHLLHALEAQQIRYRAWQAADATKAGGVA